MSKQTAVEWLVEKLLANALLRLTKDEHSVYKELKEQAKAMEREQQRLIYEGLLQNVGTSIKQSDLPTFEQYYNSTYKGGSNEEPKQDLPIVNGSYGCTIQTKEQETLEEASERYAMDNFSVKAAVKFGAKWQQERMSNKGNEQ